MADEPEWLNGLDETPLIITGRLSNKNQDKAPQFILPLALLESVVGMEGIKRLHDEPRLCAVLKVPGPDWVHAFHALMKPWNWDFAHCRMTPLRASQAADDTTSGQTISALSAGGRVLGISQDPAQLLPASMKTGADMTIELPAPTGRVVAAVIRRMTGKLPRNLPDEMPIPLSFDEICACLRPRESATKAVERLKKAMSGRNLSDPMTADVPHIRDLHGYGAAQQWALDLIDDLEAWRKGELDFDQIDSAVVLASNPGLGKTTFARSLARSAGLPLIATSVAAWFSNSPGFLDSVIKEIDKLFAQARSMAPAVVFFDEIDAIPNRATLSPRGADWWLPVVTHILTTLDGAVADTTNRLVILGATNHPEKLDRALIRPGRLNRVIAIQSPDAEALAGIFRQHLGKDLAGEDLTHVAQLAIGGSGAQVVQWVKAARRLARSAKRPMRTADLTETIAPADPRSAKALDATAVHEAAHAVAALVLEIGGVESINMVMRNGNGGSTFLQFDGMLPTRQSVEDFVIQLLAGRAAEEQILGEAGTGSGGNATSDLALSTRYVATLYISEGFGENLIYRGDRDDVPIVLARNADIARAVDEHLKRLYRRAMDLAAANRHRIRAVADELLKTRVMSGERFQAIVVAADAAIGTEIGSDRND